MATFGLRNIVAASDENQVFRGKLKPQPEIKRAALKEVGNRVLAQPNAKAAQNAEIPGKKPITQHLPKQPAIKVKETKACRLRTQHSRQSLSRVCDKKTSIPDTEQVSKDVHVPKNDNLPKASNVPKMDAIEEECNKSLMKTDVNGRHDAPGAFSSTLLKCDFVDIDKDDENDPILLGMYAKDMYKYLREMEVKFPITPQYLKSSKLTGKMRATLIDWLIDVQREFEMIPETLFMTVAIIDRYLEKNPAISRSKLQLVGIAAMYIANKYEEIMLLDINELVYVCDNTYTKKEILQMEVAIIKSLDCSFGRPLPIHFLRRYSKADQVAPLTHVMAKYFMEMGIMEYDLCHVAPSLLAAAALYISLWIVRRKTEVWSANLIKYSGYSEKDILPVVKKLCSTLANAAASKHQAIQKKYSHPKNLQVSTLPVLKRITELPDQL